MLIQSVILTANRTIYRVVAWNTGELSASECSDSLGIKIWTYLLPKNRVLLHRKTFDPQNLGCCCSFQSASELKLDLIICQPSLLLISKNFLNTAAATNYGDK